MKKYLTFLLTIVLVFISTTVDSQVTEEEFNRAIDKVERIYTPYLKSLNLDLELKRNWHELNKSSHTNSPQKDGKIFVTLNRTSVNYPNAVVENVIFTFCHELGHHLGGVPQYPKYSGTEFRGVGLGSSEGQSDYWAFNKCMKRVLQEDDNQTIVNRLNIPSIAKTECRKVWSKKDEIALCERLLFIISRSSFASRIDSSKNVLELSDPVEVVETLNKHPGNQCRVETMKAAALCNAPLEDNVSSIFMNRGSCTRLNENFIGARPRCWFKPVITTPHNSSHEPEELIKHLKQDHVEVIATLVEQNKISLNKPLSEGLSPLMLAIKFSSFKISSYLIELPEVNVNFKGRKGYAALMFMANNNDFSFLFAKALERSDVDVNIQTEEGFTPLMIAANRANFLTLEHLLKHKDLNFDLKDNQGRDVYFFANKARFKKEVLDWIERKKQSK